MFSAVAFGATIFAVFQFDDFALFFRSPVALPERAVDCFRQTRPLTELSFWLNDALFGRAPFSWHFADFLLHLAVVALAYDVLKKLLSERAAFIAAAIFAVHPILTEPVAYLFARGTLLAALFSLLAMRSWLAEKFWIAAAWFTIAMLCKEECAALPLVLLLLPRRRNIPAVIAMLAIALSIGLRAVFAGASVEGSGVGANAGISPLHYLAAQSVVIWRYLRLVAIPWGFSVDPSLAQPKLWIELVAWAALAALCLIPFRGRFWFLMGLLLIAPSSSILPAADLAADRRMYLPMIAFCACAGLLFESVDRRIIAGMLVVLTGISIRYSLLWQSPEALWSEAVRLAPDAIRPRLQLARALPPDQALEKLTGDDPVILTERGRILMDAHRPGDALKEFGKVLAAHPNDATAISNRAVALAALGAKEAAILELKRALKIDPNLIDAKENLRVLEAKR